MSTDFFNELAKMEIWKRRPHIQQWCCLRLIRIGQRVVAMKILWEIMDIPILISFIGSKSIIRWRLLIPTKEWICYRSHPWSKCRINTKYSGRARNLYIVNLNKNIPFDPNWITTTATMKIARMTMTGRRRINSPYRKIQRLTRSYMFRRKYLGIGRLTIYGSPGDVYGKVAIVW